jgi:hypothetical protein
MELHIFGGVDTMVDFDGIAMDIVYFAQVELPDRMNANIPDIPDMRRAALRSLPNNQKLSIPDDKPVCRFGFFCRALC